MEIRFEKLSDEEMMNIEAGRVVLITEYIGLWNITDIDYNGPVTAIWSCGGPYAGLSAMN